MLDEAQTHAQDDDLAVVSATSSRAFFDAMYRHLLDMAYEKLKDPEYREILEDFLDKTADFIRRKNRQRKK